MTKATKWEYQYEYVQAAIQPGTTYSHHDPDAVRNALNRAGEEGWELVSMEPEWSDPARRLLMGWYVTFKRPRGGQ